MRSRRLRPAVHPRRRWCSPQRSGNRVRVARYYDRHHPAKTPETRDVMG
ncbi:CGNR zinc finger domain-containing protein [Nocardia sienata]